MAEKGQWREASKRCAEQRVKLTRRFGDAGRQSRRVGVRKAR